MIVVSRRANSLHFFSILEAQRPVASAAVTDETVAFYPFPDFGAALRVGNTVAEFQFPGYAGPHAAGACGIPPSLRRLSIMCMGSRKTSASPRELQSFKQHTLPNISHPSSGC